MIVFIRHATPKIDYSSCNYQAAKDRLQDYNQTEEVEESEIDAFHATTLYKKILERAPVIYCSPVSRAERTCQLLFKHDNNYLINSELREVGLEVFYLPLLKMKVRTWFLISRLAWLLRLSNEKEKVEHAVYRTKGLLPLLEQADDVVIVSHGYLIHYLKKHLRNKHYKVSDCFKQGCFTVEVWEK